MTTHGSFRCCVLALLAACSLLAQYDISVTVPEGVPLELVEANFSNSEFESRGGALVIDLDGSVRFRNLGPGEVRAVTLALRTNDAPLGGRAAVAVPSLHAISGEEFSVGLHVRMLRPLPAPPGPVVYVSPDAVLFEDLAHAGPNELGSVRKMTLRELEARRDREHFLSRWRSGGRGALVAAVQASILRQAERPKLDVRLASHGTALAGTGVRRVQFAIVRDEGAPLVLESGTALVKGTISDAPRITLRNRSDVAVEDFEVGWLVHDGGGQVYSAGAAPSTVAGPLNPGDVIETATDRRYLLSLPESAETQELTGMTAYVRSVRMADGTFWIPSTDALSETRVLHAVPVSDEERRLTEIYRQHGPAALAEELERLSP